MPAATHVLVEFAGLPGAGKSTLAESTRRTLLATGVPSRVSDTGISASVPATTRALRRLTLAGAELARHPVRGVRAIRAIRLLAPTSARDAVAGAVQWFAVRRLEAQANRTRGIHLLQEGTVQTLWTLSLRARGRHQELLCQLPERRAEAPRADRPVPHLLVVVESPLDVVSARLAARGSRHSRTQLLAEDERTAELFAGQALLREIVAAYDRRYLLLVNDGSDTPEDLGGRIADWVLRVGT